MITTKEYIREKALKETAEARVRELEAELAALKKPQTEVVDDIIAEPDRQDIPE